MCFIISYNFSPIIGAQGPLESYQRFFVHIWCHWLQVSLRGKNCISFHAGSSQRTSTVETVFCPIVSDRNFSTDWLIARRHSAALPLWWLARAPLPAMKRCSSSLYQVLLCFENVSFSLAWHIGRHLEVSCTQPDTSITQGIHANVACKSSPPETYCKFMACKWTGLCMTTFINHNDHNLLLNNKEIFGDEGVRERIFWIFPWQAMLSFENISFLK